jgi:lipoate-protein ligase A
MEIDNIKLARRQSGGGAVFHDLGNTNFTFMSSKKTFDKNKNNKIIIDALKKFNLDAFASGRNDLCLATLNGDLKFSGSAFKETKDRSFHHGTLLLNTNLEKLSNYLTPHPKKLQSKGIQSVRSRVINLSELNNLINHENLSQSIIFEFCNTYGHVVEPEVLKNDILLKNPKILEHYERIKDWDWRFGEAPQFTHNMVEYFSWGLVEINLNIEKAIITKCLIFSDSIHPDMIEVMMAELNNSPYNIKSIESRLDKLVIDYSMYSDYLLEFKTWFISQIV